MATVGSHQQSTLTTPVNNTSPISADQVRSNDNAIVASYNAHDNDALLHVQTSTLAARPVAGTLGRLWFTVDERRLYYDNGSTWQDLTIDGGDVTSGTVAVAQLPVVTVAKGGTGTGTAPTNGQVLIGNGTGYTLATLTAGSNIAITNSAGGIQIDASLAGGTIAGTGISGRVARWTGLYTQGSSVLQDDGVSVGVGTAPDPTFILATTSLSCSGGVRLNAVTYTFPASQGAANTALMNNGTGGLSWALPRSSATRYYNRNQFR